MKIQQIDQELDKTQIQGFGGLLRKYRNHREESVRRDFYYSISVRVALNIIRFSDDHFGFLEFDIFPVSFTRCIETKTDYEQVKILLIELQREVVKRLLFIRENPTENAENTENTRKTTNVKHTNVFRTDKSVIKLYTDALNFNYIFNNDEFDEFQVDMNTLSWNGLFGPIYWNLIHFYSCNLDENIDLHFIMMERFLESLDIRIMCSICATHWARSYPHFFGPFVHTDNKFLPRFKTKQEQKTFLINQLIRFHNYKTPKNLAIGAPIIFDRSLAVGQYYRDFLTSSPEQAIFNTIISDYTI